MNQLISSVLILLAPWGIYFLIKRVVFLAFEDIISVFRSGNKLDATLKKKFDAAYDRDNLDEIVQVEEDAMYARLEALSKPRMSREARKMHLNHIIEWTTKNNYPGSKRQIDLLITAIKANQKYPDILAQLSSHLNIVSRAIEQTGNKKSKNFRKINGHDSLAPTPGNVSAWLAFIIYCCLVFIFRLLDELHVFVQIFFWGLMIFSLYLSLGRLLLKSTWLKFFLALVITTLFLYSYSYWHHLSADPAYYSLEGLGVEIQYPTWLVADHMLKKNDKCGQLLTVSGKDSFPPFIVKYSSKEIDVFDQKCELMTTIAGELTVSQNPTIFYIRPKKLSGLWLRDNTNISPSWTDLVTGEQKEATFSVD